MATRAAPRLTCERQVARHALGVADTDAEGQMLVDDMINVKKGARCGWSRAEPSLTYRRMHAVVPL